MNLSSGCIRLIILSGAIAAISSVPHDGGITEQVDVSRVIMNVRALDNGGNHLPNLEPDDFRVLVQGEEAEVVSVRWVEGALSPSTDSPDPVSSAPGRLIVLFFQRDLEYVRIVGLMQMVSQVRKFLDTLGPDDRVAILQYDSRLRLFADFTTDREALKAILRGALIPPENHVPADDESLSLFPGLDPEAALDSYTPETGVLVTARALHGIPGTKDLLYFGWGMGRITGAGVIMQPDYPEMRQTLIDSGTSLFSIDYVQSDIHGLEGPLRTAATETGGRYFKTYMFSIRAINSVARSIAGHYELTFVPPELPAGRHHVRIKLPGRRGWVYHQSYYTD